MADLMSISSKPTWKVHKPAQKLSSYSPTPSLAKRQTEADSTEVATQLSSLTIGNSQTEPEVAQKPCHPVCATETGPIEPKPNPLAGPSGLDSGYGSSASAPSTSTSTSTLPEKQRSKPTLKPFPKAIPTEIQNRFNDFRVLHAPALLDTVAKRKAQNISMKLKYLGQSEETARLYIVVQCDRGIVKKVERFLSQKHVLEDLGSDFLVDVRGGTLLSLSGATTLVVSGVLESKTTFCGMPILISNGDAHRRATFGGLISVRTTSKGTILYGVTAAHPAASLAPPPISDAASDDSNSEDEDSNQPMLDTSTKISTRQHVEEKDAFASESKNLGTITEPGLFRRGDLALIELAPVGLLPNHISQSQPMVERQSITGTNAPSQSLNLFAWAHLRQSFQPCPAALLTSRGLQHGQISSSRSVLATSLDANFVEVFDFCPDQGVGACRDLYHSLAQLTCTDAKTELLPGDSGSWAVDLLTGEVYGHVVSADVFGEASVIPIQTSLKIVKEQLHAHEVRLPTSAQISLFQWTQRTVASANAKIPGEDNTTSAIREEEQEEAENEGTKPKNSEAKGLIKPDGHALPRPDSVHDSGDARATDRESHTSSPDRDFLAPSPGYDNHGDEGIRQVLETARQETEKWRAKAGEYEEQLKKIRNDLEQTKAHLDNETQVLWQETEHFRETKADFTKTNENLTKTNQDLTKTNQDLTKTNEDLTKTNQGLTETNQDLFRTNQDLTDQLAQLNIDYFGIIPLNGEWAGSSRGREHDRS